MDWNLERFKRQQAGDYETALEEVRRGRKRSHWIWYIFPQLKGLGRSQMADYYGISGLEEAKAFLKDPLLHDHLVEISRALLDLLERNPERVFGWPDVLKVCSCMTLFERASEGKEEVFSEVLEAFYGGRRDRRTLELLERGEG